MIENLTKCEREGGGDLVDPSDLRFMRWSGGSDVADFPVPQNVRGRVAVTWYAPPTHISCDGVAVVTWQASPSRVSCERGVVMRSQTTRRVCPLPVVLITKCSQWLVHKKGKTRAYL